MNYFDTIAKLASDGSDNVMLSPLTNIEEISERKRGWGYVKIAIPNALAHRLLVEESPFMGGLLLANRETVLAAADAGKGENHER